MKKVDDSSSNDGFLLRMGLNDNKAGMQGLDKEKINKIIMEATKVGLITFFFFPLSVLQLFPNIVSPSSSYPQILSLTCVNGGQLLRRNACVGREGRLAYLWIHDQRVLEEHNWIGC